MWTNLFYQILNKYTYTTYVCVHVLLTKDYITQLFLHEEFDLKT